MLGFGFGLGREPDPYPNPHPNPNPNPNPNPDPDPDPNPNPNQVDKIACTFEAPAGGGVSGVALLSLKVRVRAGARVSRPALTGGSG